MGKTTFHIEADGSIGKCRNMKRCKHDKHWAEAEHVRIHLSNIAYRAEVKAKVNEFNAIAGDFNHPQHFRANFADTRKNDAVRKFSDKIEAYKSYHGTIPAYLYGMRRWDFEYHSTRYNRITIETKPVIESEHGAVTRVWTATLSEHDQYIDRYTPRAERTIDIDIFEGWKRKDEILENLEHMFIEALNKQNPPSDYYEHAEEARAMVQQCVEMFNAVRSIDRPEQDLDPFETSDFDSSEDYEIIVDIEYRRSMFTPQLFRDYVQYGKRRYFWRDNQIDAQIRIKDTNGSGEKTAYWTLERQDGSWSGRTKRWDGEKFSVEISNSEDVRGHVYWFMMNEGTALSQEHALEMAQFAADVYTAVEEELNDYNTSVRQKQMNQS